MRARLPSVVLVAAGLVVLVLSGAAAAQTPPAAPAAAAPAAGDDFTYSPDGRRDPFVSLFARGSERRTSGAPGDGLASLAVDELSVRGIVQTGRGPVAMVQAPDGRTYLARANDHLLDGTIKTITSEGLVILQEVNDPLSLVKQREVRKLLRGIEEGK